MSLSISDFLETHRNRVLKLEYSVQEEEDFYQYIENDKTLDLCAFENNWSYIVQATRYDGYVYKNNNVAVYFRFRQGEQGNIQMVIVNNIGDGSIEKINELQKNALKFGISTLIKNVDVKLLPEWLKLGFNETKRPWSKYSFRDDNSFPLHISLTNDVLNLVKHRVRDSTRTIIRKVNREIKIKVQFYDQRDENDARNLLNLYGEYMENKGVESKKEVVDAHVFVFDKNIKNKIAISFFEDNELLALSYFTLTKTTLFWNAVINKNKTNIMRFIIWKSLDFMKSNNITVPEFFSLQGSESEGQSFWKESFKPVRVINKTHITNESVVE